MKVTVEVAGFQELDAALADLPEAFRRNVVLRALRRAGAPIVKSARARAPRGKDPRRRGSKKDRKSGRSVSIGAAADSIKVRAVRATAETEAAVSIGPDGRHFYLKFREFGTAHQRSVRFLTPAFEEDQQGTIEAIGMELWKSIARTAAGLRSKAEANSIDFKSRKALSE